MFVEHLNATYEQNSQEADVHADSAAFAKIGAKQGDADGECEREQNPAERKPRRSVNNPLSSNFCLASNWTAIANLNRTPRDWIPGANNEIVSDSSLVFDLNFSKITLFWTRRSTTIEKKNSPFKSWLK